MSKIIIIIITAIFVINLSFNCEAKSKNKNEYWMPKEYLHALKSGNPDKEALYKLIVPVYAFQFVGSKIKIMNWGGESYETHNLKLISKKQEIYKVKGKLKINLMDFEGEIDTTKLIYTESDYFIIKENNIAKLVIRNKIKTDTVVFSKYLDENYPILEPNTDPLKLKLIGKYDIYDRTDILLDSNIQIQLDGKISGSSFLSKFKINDVGFKNKAKNAVYHGMDFMKLNGKIIKGYIYFKEQITIEFYSEKIFRSEIIDNSEIIFILKKK